MIQRRNYLSRSTKPIRRVGKKRTKQNRSYTVLRKAWLLEHPYCKICMDQNDMNLTKDVHHSVGRIGEKLLATETWVPVCRACHHKIHANPSWARAEGYLK